MQIAKAFKFNGRITRKEYWFTYSAIVGISMGAGLLAGLLGFGPHETYAGALVPLGATLIGFWTGLAASTKRLHDIGRSGWLLIKIGAAGGLLAIGFALFSGVEGLLGKIVASIFALVLLCLNLYLLYLIGFKPGDAGTNEFGAPHSGTVAG